ncbi:MAG: hypothetical protein WAP08_13030 [Smithellaceae bacterium]|nr:hypothetical protein [Smithellaceae bacterium]
MSIEGRACGRERAIMAVPRRMAAKDKVHFKGETRREKKAAGI